MMVRSTLQLARVDVRDMLELRQWVEFNGSPIEFSPENPELPWPCSIPPQFRWCLVLTDKPFGRVFDTEDEAHTGFGEACDALQRWLSYGRFIPSNMDHHDPA